MAGHNPGSEPCPGRLCPAPVCFQVQQGFWHQPPHTHTHFPWSMPRLTEARSISRRNKIIPLCQVGLMHLDRPSFHVGLLSVAESLIPLFPLSSAVAFNSVRHLLPFFQSILTNLLFTLLNLQECLTTRVKIQTRRYDNCN